MSVHKNLTGADLHEPKGADTALTGQVYVANGSGGGVWTDATSVVTNTAFTTGDLKITHKTTADTSWIMWQEGSIGDGSSAATIRANADTSALFIFYWDRCSNTICPVSGGRGASGAADFAAHKRLTLPAGNARLLGMAGAATGLTTRTLGDGSIGSETRVLSTSNLPPYTPTGTVAITTIGIKTRSGSIATSNDANSVFEGNTGQTLSSPNNGPIAQPTASFTGVAQGGTSTAFSIMPPTTFVNVMIKL